MPPIARIAPLLAVLALAGCGGGDDDSSKPPATRTTTGDALPAGLAPPVTLRRTYPFQGSTRSVDTVMVPGSVLDPWRNPVVPVPKGSRLMAVQMTWLDRGRDPFPREWARFAGRDDKGKQLAAPFLGPARRSGKLTVQPVGFVVEDGRRVASVAMTSIVAVWPFRANWRLRGN